MRRTEAAADDSLAAIFARSKFGIAIAAMIKMIATTIRSSMSENPLSAPANFCLEDMRYPLGREARCSPPEQAVHMSGVSTS